MAKRYAKLVRFTGTYATFDALVSDTKNGIVTPIKGDGMVIKTGTSSKDENNNEIIAGSIVVWNGNCWLLMKSA